MSEFIKPIQLGTTIEVITGGGDVLRLHVMAKRRPDGSVRQTVLAISGAVQWADYVSRRPDAGRAS